MCIYRNIVDLTLSELLTGGQRAAQAGSTMKLLLLLLLCIPAIKAQASVEYDNEVVILIRIDENKSENDEFYLIVCMACVS